MVKIKFNFYNVYNSYYKNINETLKSMKCKFFFSEGFYFLNEGFQEIDVFYKFIINKTALFKKFANFLIIKNAHYSYINKHYKHPRISLFYSKKVYQHNYIFNYVSIYNILKM